MLTPHETNIERAARVASPLAFLILSLTFTGCSSEMFSSPVPPPMATVTGKVTLDGVPVANANVVFIPVSFLSQDGHKQYLSYGVTDDDGNFELIKANGTPGATPGWNRVMISSLGPEGRQQNIQNILDGLMDTPSAAAMEGVARQFGFEGQPPDERIPAMYNKRSMLTFEIPHDQESAEAVFELTTVDPLLLQTE
ncbi:MAG: carboxypeptidase-like regulatory domain-containing protein [Planctomycetota bacterium]